MGEVTGIEWTDSTWNPWRGCRKVSEGCRSWYMYRDMTRYGQKPEQIIRAKPATFNAPVSWSENLPRHIRNGTLVFTCSWSDFFIPFADEWREDAWEIIRRTPNLTYQILTKRPEAILDRLPADWGEGWPNVWLGVTAENQERAEERIPLLLQVPAAVRWVSVEPMLSRINLEPYLWLSGPSTAGPWRDCLGRKRGGGGIGGQMMSAVPSGDIQWVVAGCESGPNRRPADLGWVRSIRDACSASGVPFFLKQMEINGELVKMPELDGREWREFPARLAARF